MVVVAETPSANMIGTAILMAVIIVIPRHCALCMFDLRVCMPSLHVGPSRNSRVTSTFNLGNRVQDRLLPFDSDVAQRESNQLGQPNGFLT
jgi:hypothetical protein